MKSKGFRSIPTFVLAVLAMSFGIGWGFTYLRLLTEQRRASRLMTKHPEKSGWSLLLHWLMVD